MNDVPWHKCCDNFPLSYVFHLLPFLLYRNQGVVNRDNTRPPAPRTTMSAARYRHRMQFYMGPNKSRRNVQPYGATLKPFSAPSVGAEGNPNKADKSVDLRSRDNLEILESLRSPREKDFYQDHNYFDEWENRGLDKNQKRQLKQRYPYFAPNFQVTPWVWYPGDMVEVVSGTQTGQRGAILAVVPYKNELLVQNINVQDVKIPATDTRPEQVVSREHPISVLDIRHVDPITDQICTVQFIRVRKGAKDGGGDASNNSGEFEEKRICMESGTILTTPDKKAQTDSLGDPLRDTPYGDAFEATYRPDEELPILVERKLQAMEEGFIAKLKSSYEFHSERQKQTAEQMRQFQLSAQNLAISKVAKLINDSAEGLDDWWFEELAPYTARIEAAEAALQAERDAAAAAAAAAMSTSTSATRGATASGDEVDGEEDDEQFDEDFEDADKNEADSSDGQDDPTAPSA